MTHAIPPQDLVAERFMTRKGLGYVRPREVEKIEGEYCWYFTYQLDEGDLELEVSYQDGEWDTYVTTFKERPRPHGVSA